MAIQSLIAWAGDVRKGSNLLIALSDVSKLAHATGLACTEVLKTAFLKISFICNILQFITSSLARLHQDKLINIK